METRLKQQRNRLFLRVTLIITAVWLTVSAIFCVIRLYNEKIDAQNRELANFSYAKNRLTTDRNAYPYQNMVFLNPTNIIGYQPYFGNDFDFQIVVIDAGTHQTVADTAHKIIVKYILSNEKGDYPEEYGCIDYLNVRNGLSDAQYDRIRRLLHDGGRDGEEYFLNCSRFYVIYDEFIPVELAVVSAKNSGGRLSYQPVETFALSGVDAGNNTVYRCSDGYLNAVPAAFLFDGAYNRDIVSSLTDEQRSLAVGTVATGRLEYVIYTSDYVHLNAYTLANWTDKTPASDRLYNVQYAKKINLLENCRSQLVIGVSVIFSFFFAIGLLLCFMIWQTVKSQIVQEQRRTDLTNALAHDIKTPLFVISGYACTLKENIDSDERYQYLEKIIAQTEQINSLVHKMLELSKLDSCEMKLNRSEFDLCGLMDEVLKDYDVLPDGKTVRFTRGGCCLISADRELLRTAVQNLTDNAVRYSPAGSEIIIAITDHTLVISNPSEPLTGAELKQIWRPYVRKDKSRHKKGNGLGLSIVKSILDLHGAKYELGMKEGRMVFRGEFHSAGR